MFQDDVEALTEEEVRNHGFEITQKIITAHIEERLSYYNFEPDAIQVLFRDVWSLRKTYNSIRKYLRNEEKGNINEVEMPQMPSYLSFEQVQDVRQKSLNANPVTPSPSRKRQREQQFITSSSGM